MTAISSRAFTGLSGTDDPGIATLEGRTSRRRFLIAGLGSLSVASCAWLPAGKPGYVAFQRLLYGQVYLILLASGFTMPVGPENATLFRQTAPQQWYLLQDLALINFVLSDFNKNPMLWAQVSSLVLLQLWRRHRGRAGEAGERL